MPEGSGYLDIRTPDFDSVLHTWTSDRPGWLEDARTMAQLARDLNFPVARIPGRYLDTPDVNTGEVPSGDSVLVEDETSPPMGESDGDRIVAVSFRPMLLGPIQLGQTGEGEPNADPGPGD